MRRIVCILLMMLVIFTALPAGAEQPGDTVTIAFTIPENPANAISARIGISFDEAVFEFVSAQNISRDILNSPPSSTSEMFGLLNMNGISAGELCQITLRIRENAPSGIYKVMPVVDSVYDIRRAAVALTVEGASVCVGEVFPFPLVHRFYRKGH